MDGWRGPLLGGVVADEFGQHFHHRGVVASRVVGDAFQRVDAPDTHVDLCGTELLDRLVVAVGHLPLFGEVEGAARQVEGRAGVPDAGPVTSHANDDCAAYADRG